MRLRQCVYEAFQSKVREEKRAHWLNALKYLTSLPVIASSHFIGEWSFAATRPKYDANHWQDHNRLFYAW